MATMNNFYGVTLMEVANLHSFNSVEEAELNLAKAGLRLKEVWSFAFNEALGILELMNAEANEEFVLDKLGQFIENNCTYSAYIPYAELVQITSDTSSTAGDDEVEKRVLGLLTKIADSAIEYWTRKFQH